jgi:hypothetical protein
VHYQGSAQSESLRVQRAQTEFNTTQQNVIVKNARESTFIGGGGNDQAILEELNLLEGLGSRAVAYLENHRVTAENMSFLEARSVDRSIRRWPSTIWKWSTSSTCSEEIGGLGKMRFESASLSSGIWESLSSGIWESLSSGIWESFSSGIWDRFPQAFDFPSRSYGCCYWILSRKTQFNQ